METDSSLPCLAQIKRVIKHSLEKPTSTILMYQFLVIFFVGALFGATLPKQNKFYHGQAVQKFSCREVSGN